MSPIVTGQESASNCDIITAYPDTSYIYTVLLSVPESLYPKFYNVLGGPDHTCIVVPTVSVLDDNTPVLVPSDSIIVWVVGSYL